MKNWIQQKHNGVSGEVNKGNLRLVDKEIDDAIEWIENRYQQRHYPESVHNSNVCVYDCDILFIAEHFTGNLPNQKRLFKLIGYARPRSNSEWIFCPQSKWIEIASRDKYFQFIWALEQRGILERPGSFCKINNRIKGHDTS